MCFTTRRFLWNLRHPPEESGGGGPGTAGASCNWQNRVDGWHKSQGTFRALLAVSNSSQLSVASNRSLLRHSELLFGTEGRPSTRQFA
ncbi:hypothetical protein BDN72DRAFT_134566 [Pluteus cervinus]|uniref:Uncharacterized protein n=1 Tax=Pluteus cervinus TaxID=181527 RepID=A0ACD3B8A7_9AGAR|nr:hypothetical protein BDN72DRAFT_134566 [Pluteus cervinus]